MGMGERLVRRRGSVNFVGSVICELARQLELRSVACHHHFPTPRQTVVAFGQGRSMLSAGRGIPTGEGCG
jgi:hypothetical protein